MRQGNGLCMNDLMKKLGGYKYGKVYKKGYYSFG